ncbi:GSCOCG00007022001-RA-CDS [Cotesia congregata]|nr:GSCOCG00007022001-RA-CDS [Cotesia congregata]
MVKSFSRAFFLWIFLPLMIVALVAQQVDSKGHHQGHYQAHHPKCHHVHKKSVHSQAIRNKRSELSTIQPFSNFFVNKSVAKSSYEKSLTDLEKLFGPIPEELYDHIRVKRNNFNNVNHLASGGSSASSEYLKKLADSFAGPAEVESDEDNLDEQLKNDKQVEDVRKKREVDEEEIINFFPENSPVVNLIRTKRFGDPDKRLYLKRNRRNKLEKNISNKSNKAARLKRKSKVKSNINSKVKKSIKRKNNKPKLKLKRCSKNHKNKKKHDEDKARVKRRPEESGARPLSSLEEIRGLAANLVSKVDELEGSIKINRRSGRNPHGYASGISNSKYHRILGARHSGTLLKNILLCT